MIQKFCVMKLYMLWTKIANTIATNETSTVSLNCHSKKGRYKIDFYILYTVLLVIILL